MKIIITFIICLIFISCSVYDSEQESIMDILPHESYNVEKLGNGWIQFELNNKTFIYKKETEFLGYRSYECLTQITK